MNLNDLTDEMIEKIDSGEACVWDGAYMPFKRTEKPVERFSSDLATTLPGTPE